MQDKIIPVKPTDQTGLTTKPMKKAEKLAQNSSVLENPATEFLQTVKSETQELKVKAIKSGVSKADSESQRKVEDHFAKLSNDRSVVNQALQLSDRQRQLEDEAYQQRLSNNDLAIVDLQRALSDAISRKESESFNSDSSEMVEGNFLQGVRLDFLDQ